jgi:hypothetical protein
MKPDVQSGPSLAVIPLGLSSMLHACGSVQTEYRL